MLHLVELNIKLLYDTNVMLNRPFLGSLTNVLYVMIHNIQNDIKV